ncbi:hypothetical protein GGG16DRAFT_84018 [Schizophyllum commune]
MSSATLTGVALLQNARKADCSSTIVDARFRLASGSSSSNGPRELVAALCLTHADDKSPDLEGFFVVRAEVRTADMTDLPFSPTPGANYHLVGELIQVMPFQRGGFMTQDDAKPRLFATGSPSNINLDELLFSFVPSPHSASALPLVQVYTPVSNRQRRKDVLIPLLKDSCYVDVEGFVSNIQEDENFGNLTSIDLEFVRATKSSAAPVVALRSTQANWSTCYSPQAARKGVMCCAPLRPAQTVVAGRKRKLASD